MSGLVSIRKLVVSQVLFVVIAFGSAMSVNADPVTFTLSGPDFSGSGNAVVGSVTVLIANSGANTVTFTITNNTDGFVREIYLNNTGAALADNVDASCTICTAIGGSVSVARGSNAFKADGDGFFDIDLLFPVTPISEADRFTPGESITFTMTAPGLISDSFLAFSCSACPGANGNGPFRIAAHIQTTGPSNGGSAWITESEVPEPTSMLLLGTGIVALAAGLRKR